MPEALSALWRLAESRPQFETFRELDGDSLTYARLAKKATALAEEARALPPAVGVLAGNCLDWIVADLGLTMAGKTIVLDAGHGGKDPGAISVLGFYEKTVVLAVTRRVAARLERRGAKFRFEEKR